MELRARIRSKDPDVAAEAVACIQQLFVPAAKKRVVSKPSVARASEPDGAVVFVLVNLDVPCVTCSCWLDVAQLR